jgi:hypothetical protein
MRMRRFTPLPSCASDSIRCADAGEVNGDARASEALDGSAQDLAILGIMWVDLIDLGCAGFQAQSQDSAPPVWYSMTRVSKKLRSFFRSIISLIQGKGFSSLGNKASKPICTARRLAM